WRGLDAIVLPGGSFRLRHNTGCADLSVRAAALAEAGLVAPLRNAATKLSRSPSVAIIAGADGPDSDKTRAAGAPGGGDQLCVAWNSAGVAAVGRKVFPTWDAYPKTGDYEGDRLTCCAE